MSGYGIRFTEFVKEPFLRVHRGIDKLAQLCEKYILTTYGSDEKHPDTGCNLKMLIGQNFPSLEEAGRLINQEVERVEEQIIRIQMKEISKGFKIPLDEQLRSLSLVDVSYDREGERGIIVTYEVTNRKGDRVEGELVSA